MKASGNDGCDPEEHRIAAGPVTAVARQRKDYQQGDDDEEVDGKSAFCRAAPALAQCHHSLHHRVTERFPA